MNLKLRANWDQDKEWVCDDTKKNARIFHPAFALWNANMQNSFLSDKKNVAHETYFIRRAYYVDMISFYFN